MNDWQNHTVRVMVVGPRLRDRARMAWQVMRGFNRMEYSINVRVMVPDPENVVFIDGAEANLTKEDT